MYPYVAHKSIVWDCTLLVLMQHGFKPQKNIKVTPIHVQIKFELILCIIKEHSSLVHFAVI